MGRLTGWSSVSAVGAAFASAVCYAGPLLYVTLGVGAGVASTFEPLRPWFLAAAVLGLGFGFRSAYGDSDTECAGEGACDNIESARRKRRRERALVWVSAVLVAVFATFPTWSAWLR